jgi:hypothetical protein
MKINLGVLLYVLLVTLVAACEAAAGGDGWRIIMGVLCLPGTFVASSVISLFFPFGGNLFGWNYEVASMWLSACTINVFFIKRTYACLAGRLRRKYGSISKGP